LDEQYGQQLLAEYTSGVTEVARTPDSVSDGSSKTKSVGVRGFACEAGVSGWRLGTPTGLSFDGLPSKDKLDMEEQPEPDLPYMVDPEHIYSTSVNSNLYDKQKVDDIVFIGMCNLYERVIPALFSADIEHPAEAQFTYETPNVVSPGFAYENKFSSANTRTPTSTSPAFFTIPHMPYHIKVSEQSYSYTSEYEHNKLVVMIFEQSLESFSRKMYVQFTIVPKYTPTEECVQESDKIDKLVLDVIYTKLYDYFEHLRSLEYDRQNEYDEHSRT
jgi:hypothetical protein